MTLAKDLRTDDATDRIGKVITLQLKAPVLFCSIAIVSLTASVVAVATKPNLANRPASAEFLGPPMSLSAAPTHSLERLHTVPRLPLGSEEPDGPRAIVEQATAAAPSTGPQLLTILVAPVPAMPATSDLSAEIGNPQLQNVRQ